MKKIIFLSFVLIAQMPLFGVLVPTEDEIARCKTTCQLSALAKDFDSCTKSCETTGYWTVPSTLLGGETRVISISHT